MSVSRDVIAEVQNVPESEVRCDKCSYCDKWGMCEFWGGERVGGGDFCSFWRGEQDE